MPTIAVVLVIGLLAFMYIGLGAGEDSESGSGTGLLADAYRGLTLGSTRAETEERVGPGEDALEFTRHGGTGVATEPMDADCVYYLGGQDFSSVVQLCFRDDRLIRKRRYAAEPS